MECISISSQIPLCPTALLPTHSFLSVPHPLLTSPGSHQYASDSINSFAFSRILCKWNHIAGTFGGVWRLSLSIIILRFIYVVVHINSEFFFILLYGIASAGLGPPWRLCSKESACQCRRCKRCMFNLWVGKIP